MKYKEEDKQITYDQLKEIMLDDIRHLPEIIKNVFCGNCFVTELVDYIIYLNKTGAVVLRGHCKKCGRPAARVLETDEDPQTAERAKRIYKTAKKARAVEGEK